MYSIMLEWQKRSGLTLDAIVHVGDFGIDETAGDWRGILKDKSVPIPTYVCMGNHEDWASICRWQKNPSSIKNLFLLPDGQVTEICGMAVGCVWGNYSSKSYKNPQRIYNARLNNVPGSMKKMHILKSSVDTLLNYEGKIDILITHDCPTVFVPGRFGNREVPKEIAPLLGLDPDERGSQGCPGFTELLEKFHPQFYFFGHFHVRDYREIGGSKVICLNTFDYNPNEATEIVDFER